MRVIQYIDLLSVLLDLSSARPITFDYTSVKKRGKQFKASAPWETLTHRSRVNGFINVNYENSVNRQRAREAKPDDFVAEKRTYGERFGSVLEHNRVIMVPVAVKKYLSSEWTDENGEVVDAEEVKKHLYKKKTRQAVDKETDWKNYNVKAMGPYVAFEGEELDLSAAMAARAVPA
jgi:hypothetical protein